MLSKTIHHVIELQICMFLFNDYIVFHCWMYISYSTNALWTGSNVTMNSTLKNIHTLSESIQLSPEDKFPQVGIAREAARFNHC